LALFVVSACGRAVIRGNEQGAGFIAQGIARATGRAGVCIGTQQAPHRHDRISSTGCATAHIGLLVDWAAPCP